MNYPTTERVSDTGEHFHENVSLLKQVYSFIFRKSSLTVTKLVVEVLISIGSYRDILKMPLFASFMPKIRWLFSLSLPTLQTSILAILSYPRRWYQCWRYAVLTVLMTKNKFVISISKEIYKKLLCQVAVWLEKVWD